MREQIQRTPSPKKRGEGDQGNAFGQTGEGLGWQQGEKARSAQERSGDAGDFLDSLDDTLGQQPGQQPLQPQQDAADTSASESSGDGDSGDPLESVRNSEESGATQEPTRGDKGEGDWDVTADEGEEGGSGGKRSRRKILARRYAAGSLLGGGVVGLTMLALSTLVPLKINHIIENLEDHFNAGIDDATGKWNERLLNKYILKHVLPNLGPTCTSTIDRNCRFRSDWNERSAFGRLGAAWQDNRFEEKLAEKYGIEYMREGRNSSQYRIRVTGQPDLTFDIGDVHTEQDLIEVSGRRPAIRRATLKATEDLSFFKRTRARYKIGTLLARKYGIKRCRLGCDRRDGLTDLRENMGNKKRAYIIKFANHVVEPHSQVGAAMLSCIISQGCEDPDSYNSDGERRDKFQREVQETLQRLSAELGEKTVRELVETANSITRNGVTGHVISKVMTLVFKKEIGDQVARVAAKAIPIVGWVDMAADLLHKLDSLPIWLKRARFVAVSGIAVSQYMSYRSINDEQKVGMVDADMYGSFLDSLGTTEEGSVQAEASPLYQALIPSQTASAATLTPLVPRASAQQRTKVYTCNDGQEVDSSKKICPEDDLDTRDGISAALDFMSTYPGLSHARFVSDLWYQDFIPGPVNTSLNSIWGITDQIGGLLTNNPLARPIMNRIEGVATALFDPLMDFFSARLIGSPFSDNVVELAVAGAKNFTVMAAGVNASAFAFGQYGMGGVYATAEQIGQIRKEQEQQRLDDFAALPMRDRLFDTSTRYSLVSRIAMSLPADTPTGVFQKAAEGLSNPFVSVASIFGSVFSATKVAAQTQEDILECDDPSPYSGCDPQHVPSMIFPEANMTEDPEELTDDVCRTMNEEWQGSLDEEENDYRIINPENGMDLYRKPNLCKLNCTSTTGLGATSGDATITQEEHGECGVVDNASSGTPTGPVGAECPAGITPEAHPSRRGYYKMPDAPNGEYAIYSGDSQRYGSLTLVCMLYNVGIAFNQAMHGSSKLQIGDLNASGHKSHYKGVAVDVDGAGLVRAADNTRSGYSTAATITLGKIFMDTGIIRNIWWCDAGDGSTREIINHARRPGGPGFEGQVKCLSGHYNHFHVDIRAQYAIPGCFTPPAQGCSGPNPDVVR
jgi:hypothetical protein